MRKKKGLTFYKKNTRLRKDIFFEVLSFLFWGAVMILLAFVLVFCFGIRTSVIGNSMQPTLYNGQHILINRFIYYVSDPKAEDVVVFLPRGNQNYHYYVKRVVGVPGDTVQIQNGWLYINGAIYEDSDKYGKIEYGGIAENPIVLGEDEYFVLGDNRANEDDSRSGDIGIVKKEYIYGEAWYAYKTGNIQAGLIN